MVELKALHVSTGDLSGIICRISTFSVGALKMQIMCVSIKITVLYKNIYQNIDESIYL